MVVARPDAAHVRGGRVGVCPLWRPHARCGHHRGPRRHPADSHPPRAPDRGADAQATAVRPVRLELKSACRCRRSRADAPGVSGPVVPGACPPRSGGSDGSPGLPGRTRPATPARPLCAALLRSGRKCGEHPGWGVRSTFTKPRSKFLYSRRPHDHCGRARNAAAGGCGRRTRHRHASPSRAEGGPTYPTCTRPRKTSRSSATTSCRRAPSGSPMSGASSPSAHFVKAGSITSMSMWSITAGVSGSRLLDTRTLTERPVLVVPLAPPACACASDGARTARLERRSGVPCGLVSQADCRHGGIVAVGDIEAGAVGADRHNERVHADIDGGDHGVGGGVDH